MQEPTSYQSAILVALQSKPIYLGTADQKKVRRSRKANKLARAQRRVNRRLDTTA